jgi:hypothetical protein
MTQTKRISRLTWIVIATLAALFALAVLAVPGAIGVSLYLKRLRGYGIGCAGHIIQDAVSPSGRWTARAQRVDCFLGALDPAPWIEVTLIPNDRPRLLARRWTVFYRRLVDASVPRIAVTWTTDYALEVQTLPCAPPCRTLEESEKEMILTGVVACAQGCVSATGLANIVISLKPADW